MNLHCSCGLSKCSFLTRLPGCSLAGRMSTSAATNGGSDANSGTSGTANNPVFIGTDNRCCFCLTLRTGSVIVGVVNALVSTLLFSW